MIIFVYLYGSFNLMMRGKIIILCGFSNLARGGAK